MIVDFLLGLLLGAVGIAVLFIVFVGIVLLAVWAAEKVSNRDDNPWLGGSS